MTTSHDYYDCRAGCARLSHTTIDEAVEAYLDGWDVRLWPDTLDVYFYDKEVIDDKVVARTAQAVAEFIHERFYDFERLCDPDDHRGTEPSTQDIADAEVTVRAISSRYEVKSYMNTGSIEVNVAEWVREHRPDWLDKL